MSSNPTGSRPEVIEFLKSRRSAKPALLSPPGPTAAELETILTIAARVPDHKKLAPWRFIVLEGDSRVRFGVVLAEALVAAGGDQPSATRLDGERKRLLRAPVVVAVVSRIVETPGAPEWEQVLSCGAACLNLCLAANALGYGTSWITEWYSYDAHVRAALGLGDNERLAGFVYVGTEAEKQPDRDRPSLGAIVSRW